MTLFEKTTSHQLPQNNLILPLQYHVFGELHNCVMFVCLEEEIGRGSFKLVQKAFVTEIIGHLPISDVHALREKHVALFVPTENAQSFVNDIIAILKLNQRQIKDLNLRSNTAKIRGHSLYISEEYQRAEIDYSSLLYDGYLKLIPDEATFLSILLSSLGNTCSRSNLRTIVNEILQANDLINSAFMIEDILPFSVYEAFPKMSSEEILQNVYQMFYTVVAYAQEGVYFRDLQPDNFRVDQKGHVKIIDPSYIDASISPSSRYTLFLRETTPEYLPSVLVYLQRKNAQEEIRRYFGDFTEGICIGMLERVLKRIFLPKYMKSCDMLCYITDAKERIESANSLKFKEDLDLFRDIIEILPSTSQFQQYQINIASLMQQENIYPEKIFIPISRLLACLRHFSSPVFTSSRCCSYLSNYHKEPLSIEQLHSHVLSILGIAPSSQMIYNLNKSKDVIENLPHQPGKIIQPVSKPSALSSLFQTKRLLKSEIDPQSKSLTKNDRDTNRLTKTDRHKVNEEDVIFDDEPQKEQEQLNDGEDDTTEDVIFENNQEDKPSKEEKEGN